MEATKSIKRSKRFLCLLSVFWAAIANADRIYVDAKRPQAGADGISWCTAYPDLQQALNRPGGPHEIWVARFFLEDSVTPGSYKPSATFPNPPSDTDRSKTFYIKPGIQVYGGFLGADPLHCAFPDAPDYFPGEDLRSERNPEANITVLDGDIGLVGVTTDNCYHVVYFQGNDPENDTKLSGFTIRGGRADGSPGGQQDQAGDDRGAGIMVHWGENNHTGPILNRLIIEENYALHGGAGIHVFGKADTYAANLWFQNNTVEIGRGGAVLVERGNIYVQNGVFYKNRCIVGPGGGLALAQTDRGQTAVLTNCTFYGNLSDTPLPNEVLTAGAVFSDVFDRLSVDVRNCIAWNNSPPQIESWLSLSVAVTFSDVQDGPWSGFDPSNIMLDPFFHHAETATPANGRLRVRLCSRR